MPTQCGRDLFGFARVEGRRVEAAFDGGDATLDAGPLLLGATDRAIGLMRRFAACFDDGRTPVLVEHSVATMVAQRVFGIALGYEDLVDHDQLRHDPVLATLAGKLVARRKSCAPLAGKSTLNRLEHAPAGASRYHKIGHDGAAIERLLVDVFLEAHKAPLRRIVLDLDATDDPRHGHQEGRFFHGYYDCHCYLRCTCSAAASCSPPSSGARTSMRQGARSREAARIIAQIRTCWSRVENFAAGQLRLRARGADELVRGQPSGLRLRPRPEPAPGRSDRRQPRTG